MKYSLHLPAFHAMAAAVSCAFLTPTVLFAQQVDYIGGANSLWSESANWDGVAPGASGTAVISNRSGSPSIVDSDFTVGSLLFSGSTASSVSIGVGAKLILTGSGVQPGLISNSGSHSLTIGGDGQLVLSGSGAMDIVAANRSITITSEIAESGGSRGIIKTGAGTLNLLNAASSSFSGGVTLKAGTLTTNVSSTGTANSPTQGPLGTGVFTLEGGIFRYTGSSTGVFHNSVSILGDATLGDDAAGRRSFTFTGNINLNGGQRNLTVALNDPNAAGRVVQMTGTLSNGGLTKSGAGVLRLTGNNSYTGSTLITAGTLSLSAGGAISQSDRIVVSQGAVFEIANGYALAEGQRLSGGGMVTGTFTLGEGMVASGSDGSILSLSASSTFDGGVLELDLQVGGLASLLLTGDGHTIQGNTTGAVEIAVNGVDYGPGSYLLIGTGGLTNATYRDWGVSAFSLQDLQEGWIGTLRLAGNDLYLDVQQIPEPASWALLGAALSVMGWRARRAKA